MSGIWPNNNPGRAQKLHQIFRRVASKHRAPAEFLSHRATLDYVPPKIRCTNVPQIAEAVSLFTAQVSSRADREGGMDEELRKEVSDSTPSIFSDTSDDASPITRSTVRGALKKSRKKIKIKMTRNIKIQLKIKIKCKYKEKDKDT